MRGTVQPPTGESPALQPVCNVYLPLTPSFAGFRPTRIDIPGRAWKCRDAPPHQGAPGILPRRGANRSTSTLTADTSRCAPCYGMHAPKSCVAVRRLAHRQLPSAAATQATSGVDELATVRLSHRRSRLGAWIAWQLRGRPTGPGRQLGQAHLHHIQVRARPEGGFSQLMWPGPSSPRRCSSSTSGCCAGRLVAKCSPVAPQI